VAEGVDEGLPQGFEGEQGFIGALEDARLYPAGDRQMPSQERRASSRRRKP